MSRHDPVDLLVVGVPPIPGELVLHACVCLEHLLEDEALNGDAQVYKSEAGGDSGRGQLDEDGGHVARSLAAVVHEVHAGAGDIQALL